jgi:hypothetical protein
LQAQPWVQEAFKMFGYGAAEFKLIEIDPLLAYQFIVDMPRSNHHCATLRNPTVADLMPICLPQAQPKPNDLSPLIDGPGPHAPAQEHSTVKVRNLNLQKITPGIFGLNQNGYESWVIGLQVHVTLPFVHVVRFNGRHYLHNGFHRAFGARTAGATHIPCLLRDAPTQQDAGIIGQGQTFPLDLLESRDPPTLGHFTQGEAYDVQLRSISRIFHVAWSDAVLPDEYERLSP